MSILEEALKVSGENRQRDYGHPLENHERIAAVWNVVLGKKLKAGESISPEEVVWCMIGVKLAREVNSPKADNAVDVAGYINCLDLIRQKKQRAVQLIERPVCSNPAHAYQVRTNKGSGMCEAICVFCDILVDDMAGRQELK